MKTKIAIIGGGNMGGAIIRGIHKKFRVSVCEKDTKRAQGLRRKYKILTGDLGSVVGRSKIILLAVKPQGFDKVLKEMKDFITKDKLVLSIAAGITCQFIEKGLGKGIRVVRAMPNLPAQVGEGATGVCMGKSATRIDLRSAVQLFNCVGKTVVVDERLMDAITAVSGSGPAYVFLFVECLVKAANQLGLKRNMSEYLVHQTLKGSVCLLENERDDASKLRAKVTSKGGTTEAAMDVFSSKKIEKVFQQALLAAKKRAKKLSRN